MLALAGMSASAVVVMMMAIRGTVADRSGVRRACRRPGRAAQRSLPLCGTNYVSGDARSRMRDRGACETLAHVLEALDDSRRHTRSVLRPLIAARPRSAPMRM